MCEAAGLIGLVAQTTREDGAGGGGCCRDAVRRGVPPRSGKP